jgi:Tfp pilus assembly protein FimV
MKPYLYRFLMSASLLSLASPLACALSIGEVALTSYLNEPLHARIEVQLDAGELIDDSCISLTAADGSAITTLGNLPLSDIRLQYNATQHLIHITSRQAFKDPYAVFQLKINCLQFGRVSKTLTVLPEFNDGTAPVSTAQNEQLISLAPNEATSPALSTSNLEAAPAIAPRIKPRRAKISPARNDLNVAPILKIQLPPFGLRLSTEPLDLTRFANLNPETLVWLKAQKELLNEEVSGNYLLTLNQDLTRTKQELESTKLQLSAQPFHAQKLPSTPFTEALLKASLDFLHQWETLLLAIATSLTAWLSYRAIKNYRATGIQLTASSQRAKPEVHPALEENEALAANEIAVLEEGELYAIYGHPDKGIKVLREYLTLHPNSGKIWLRLLSIYSSQGLNKEFETAAKEFSRTNKNSQSWKMAQALGRTLDAQNPLYFDNNTRTNSASASEEKQIGDVLVELGHLSPESLSQCTQEFDAEKHGRFGHYLVTKQLITHAQLDEALFKQQSVFRPRRTPTPVDVPPLDLDLDLPPINPADSGHADKHELFEFDWDFTQNKPKN